MKRSAAAHFPAATVCRLSTKRCACGRWIWYLTNWTFFLKNRVKQVKFVDRTFNCNHKHAYKIWEYIKEHDNGVTNFHFEIGGDLLREEDFELFSRISSGLDSV